MYDLLITGGTLVDGTGAPPRRADVAVKDGIIVAVGESLDGEAAETIDATGRLVTPGFVDIHTHYDGQATWDSQLEPSASHGVTTVVTGNCGVGFAPVRPGKEEWLIQLMEGVEDIPGAALAEGITWGWERFTEFLDVLDTRSWAMDVGTQIPHGAVRGYVMGDAGARNEPASAEDSAEMAAHVREAIEAGALGFSTSRTLAHLAKDGEPVPGTFAEREELFALGRAIKAGGGGVFEVAQGGLTMLDRGTTTDEMGWMADLAEETGQPLAFMVLQTDTDPNLWQDVFERFDKLLERGIPMRAQVAARPFGMLVGLQTNHPFAKRPTYDALAGLPLPERIEQLAKPAVRDAILAEADGPLNPDNPFDGIGPFLAMMTDKMFPLGTPPNYEPLAEASLGAMATAAGTDALAATYEAMLADDGKAMFMLPLFNYANGNHDAIREMLLHPGSVSSLGDAGAHCGMICDASIPTYLLTHWARDRSRGAGIDLAQAVHLQTQRTAELYGLGDRGVVEAGKKADLNVIDFETLALAQPELIHDLPAGGRRLVQYASGYDATVVSGVVTRRHDVDTGARPGRLLRGRR
ncbi:MAG: amidohydrolase family protein [Candidatus Microthrix sp.]|nr:amidohydrolase family protein [Candidatus Microthrix sp.]MBK9558981.1 amidohydrolase family protein [Candidatus Microthrix sp.]